MRMPRRRAADSLSLLVILLWSVSSSAMSLRPRGPKAADARGLSTAITGVVVDEKGKPVANAEVEAPAQAPWVPGAGQRTRTDAAGRFLISALQEQQTYNLRVSRTGFAREFLSVTPYGTTAECWITLREGATASGRVVGEAGQPVPGARVSLSYEERSDPDLSYLSTSGPDGHFEIPDLPAGRFELRVTHRDFPLLKQGGIVIPQGQKRVELGRATLPKGERLQGQVLDSESRPLADVRVWATYDRYPVPDPAAVTGPDGRFEIARFARFGHLLFCRTGYQPHRILFLVPSPASAARLSGIVLNPAPPRTRVSGRVLDEAGRPIPGVRVQRGSPRVGGCIVALVQWNPCQEPEPSFAVADARGRFAFDLSGPASTDLWVEAAGYLRETRTGIPFGPGQNSDNVEIVLRRGATVAGQVLAADASPVAGARVYASQDRRTPEAVTDAQGRYRLVAVEPGAREIRAEHPDLGQARRRLDLAAGMRRLNLTLDGQREHAVTGRVVGPDGEPLAGALVNARESPYPTRQSVYSDGDGRFRLVFPRGTLLWLSGVLDLQVTRAGYSFGHFPIKPSEAPIEGLEIRLEKGRTLTGRILGVEPERLAEVEITAEQGNDWSMGVVSPEGTYRIDDLGPGTWRVKASSGGHEAYGTVEIAAEEASLDLEIPTLRAVSGTVLGTAGEPVAGAYIQFLDEPGKRGWPPRPPSTSSREDGTFSIEIPEGTYAVTASAQSYALSPQDRPVTLTAAPIDGLEIRLRRGPILRGRVLGMPDGVSAHISVTQDMESREAETGPDGTYLVSDLGPGEWKVQASLYEEIQRIGQGRISLAPGAAEAVLDLDLSLGDLTFSGHLVDGDGALSTEVTLLRANGEALSPEELVEDEEHGNFRFPRLRAGRYILRIKDYYRDRVLLRPVDLSSDRELTIDLLNPEAP